MSEGVQINPAENPGEIRKMSIKAAILLTCVCIDLGS